MRKLPFLPTTDVAVEPFALLTIVTTAPANADEFAASATLPFIEPAVLLAA